MWQLQDNCNLQLLNCIKLKYHIHHTQTHSHSNNMIEHYLKQWSIGLSRYKIQPCYSRGHINN